MSISEPQTHKDDHSSFFGEFAGLAIVRLGRPGI